MLINVARVVQGPLDSVLCNLVEDHPLDRYVGIEGVDEVPSNRLALPILVRRDVEPVCVRHGLFQVPDDLLFVRRHHVERLKPIGHLHPEPRPVFVLVLRGNLVRRRGKIPNVPHARLDAIPALRQKFSDGSGLGRRLNDNQTLHKTKIVGGDKEAAGRQREDTTTRREEKADRSRSLRDGRSEKVCDRCVLNRARRPARRASTGPCVHKWTRRVCKKPGTGQTGTGLLRMLIPENAEAFGVG